MSAKEWKGILNVWENEMRRNWGYMQMCVWCAFERLMPVELLIKLVSRGPFCLLAFRPELLWRGKRKWDERGIRVVFTSG